MDKSTQTQAYISTNRSVAFNIHPKQHYVMENQWIMRDEEKNCVHTWFLKQKENRSQLSQWVSLSKRLPSKSARKSLPLSFASSWQWKKNQRKISSSLSPKILLSHQFSPAKTLLSFFFLFTGQHAWFSQPPSCCTSTILSPQTISAAATFSPCNTPFAATFFLCHLRPLTAYGTPFQNVSPRIKVILQPQKARLIPYDH